MASVRRLQTLGNPSKRRKKTKRKATRRKSNASAKGRKKANPRRAPARKKAKRRTTRRSRSNPKLLGKLNVKRDSKKATSRLMEFGMLAGVTGLITLGQGVALKSFDSGESRERANWFITGGVGLAGLLGFSFSPLLASGAIMSSLFSFGRILLGKFDTEGLLIEPLENKRTVDIEGSTSQIFGLGNTARAKTLKPRKQGRLNGLTSDARRVAGTSRANPRNMQVPSSEVGSQIMGLVKDRERQKPVGQQIGDLIRDRQVA